MTISLDITNLARRYEQGSVTPEAIVREIFANIRATGTSPDWISLVDEERALARARDIKPGGALYGIPFAVKDNIDVAGMETTCACPAFAYRAPRSATAVERLEAAGAILIGKTNLDQFATGLNGTRSPYGIPVSAFNPAYVSGGSSSGSAVVVAKGLVSFSLGTDTAGSGRVPAAFNNIVGMKPTKGIISSRGLVPACKSQDTISIFALTVADTAAVAKVAVAFDREDIFTRTGASYSLEALTKPLAIGVPNTPLEFFGDTEYQRLYHQTIDRLATIGAEIVPIDYRPFDEAAAMLYAGPWVAERLIATSELLDTDPEAINDVVRGILLGAQGRSAHDAFRAFYRFAEIKRAADFEWGRMDVMLLPTAGTTYRIADMLADPVRLNTDLGAYTNFANLLDLAALAVPAGFRSDGIPFGVTVVGPAMSDGKLAAIGDAIHRSLEEATLGATSIPLASTPEVEPSAEPTGKVRLAVVGAHLSGQPLNFQLAERQARLIETARTAPGYRLYALAGTKPAKPGLVFDGSGPGSIELEIWEMDDAAFGSFVALIPAPLGIGTLKLSDGRTVKGFLCESYALSGATDISEYKGWRSWLGRTVVA